MPKSGTDRLADQFSIATHVVIAARLCSLQKILNGLCQRLGKATEIIRLSGSNWKSRGPLDESSPMTSAILVEGCRAAIS